MEVCSHNRHDPKTILLKINGTDCNLSCYYCSERKKMHIGSMSLQYISDIFSQLPKDCSCILHGGEPLLNEKYISEIILMHDQIRHQPLNIQTNGFFSDSMRSLLCNNAPRVKIGISIDGPKQHSAYRTTSNDSPAFECVVKNIRNFEKHDMRIKCIATINSLNVSSPDAFLDFFLSFPCVTQLRINPCFDMSGDNIAPYAISPMQFYYFLESITTRWLQESLFHRIRIDPIQSEIENCMNNVEKKLPSDHNCSRFISVYNDRFCTLCDVIGNNGFFVQNWNNIFEEADSYYRKSNKFKNHVLACSQCLQNNCCSLGCPAVMEYMKNNDVLKNEYCLYRYRLSVLVDKLSKLF